MKRFTRLLVFVLFTSTIVPGTGIVADEVAASAEQPAASDSKPDTPELPQRWLMICCGLPGDDEHRQRLTDAIQQIIAAAEPVLGVTSDRLLLLAGDEEMQLALLKDAAGVEICTQETVQVGIRKLSQQVPHDGACWVVLLGHAQLHRTLSQFNVLDADFDQKQFAEWAQLIACREQVFVISTPVSGFWLKPLQAPSRTVISATEADLEFTGTEMPYALAAVLAGAGEHATLNDVDGDGALSLLDLYIATNLEIHGRFKALERLQTEHALLDDNGDGCGRELQLPYLPREEEPVNEELSDVAVQAVKPSVKQPKPVSNSALDGYRSRHILLRQPK